MTATTAHGRVGEYLDGRLAADDEVAVLDHVAGCFECQAELHAEVQLRDREDALRSAGPSAVALLHGRAGDYLDGSLGAADEAVFLDHVAACVACQHDLHAEVQLRDREDALRDPAIARHDTGGDAAVVNLRGDLDPAASRVSSSSSTDAARRSRRRGAGAWIAAGGAIAAAAVALIVMMPRRTTTELALALTPTRGIEIRLSYGIAAKYREYDTMRSGASPGSSAESISPEVIAKLYRAGDCHGIATAYVLSGERVRAGAQYLRCPASADIDADRAGLAVLLGQPGLAIELTEHVLDAAPDHAVALWNRALALRDLGLELSAGAAFQRVAALEASRDPDWAREAGDRSTRMHELADMRARHGEVMTLGAKMLDGGPPLPAALARRVPGRARVMLHEAIRAATTRERLDQLAPLAAALEGLAGADLGRYLVQARARLSPERAAASARYPTIVRLGTAIDDRTWNDWLALATRARADDLILGARIVTERLDGSPSAEQLASATGDPWFERAVDLLRADHALAAGRIEEGAGRLAAMAAHCPAGVTSYRCQRLTAELATLALERHQPPEALRHALLALAMSRELGEWPQRGQALTLAADAERFGGAVALADAYYEESGRSRDACGARNTAFTTAEMRFMNHQPARARALVAAAPACDEVPGAVELTMLVRLWRTGHEVLDRASLVRAIVGARVEPALASYAPYFDYLAELLVLDSDPAARARLSRVAEVARGIEGSLGDKTLAAIHATLLADAGRREQWADAVAVAARALGVAVPTRCAVTFGADDFRFVVVGVGPDGTLEGQYASDFAQPAEWLVPEPMRRKLAGCEEVAVLALPPWLGIGPVLDAQTPWHYVLGPARPAIAGRQRQVVIADPTPPASAGLAALVPRGKPPAAAEPDELITGAAATPERVLAAIADATLVEIHGHATWLDRLDAPVLALSPGADGWALGATRIRAARLTGSPVVVLAACAGGAAARFEHEAWGLPLAFRIAGARAVIASLAEVPDRDAAVAFDAITAELARGTSPAAAVAHIRAEKIRTDPTSWIRHVVVFQ